MMMASPRSSVIASSWIIFCCCVMVNYISLANCNQPSPDSTYSQPQVSQNHEPPVVSSPVLENKTNDNENNTQNQKLQGTRKKVQLEAKVLTKRDVSDSNDEYNNNNNNLENCSKVQSLATPGHHIVKEVNLLEHNFFIQPEPGFRTLMIRMKIDNLWNLNDPYITEENVVFHSKDLEDSLLYSSSSSSSSPWIEVRIKYSKHIVKYGRDKHSLIVTVGNLSPRVVRSSRWWRTHSFEGIVISVEGPANFVFDCYPPSIPPPFNPRLRAAQKPLLLGSVLGGAFLLVVVVGVIYLVVIKRKRERHHHHHPEHHNSLTDQTAAIPQLPKSQLLKSWLDRHKDGEHTYEEFDEDTLARLRQKLVPNAFTRYYEGPANTTPSATASATTCEGLLQKASSGAVAAPKAENHYENAPTLSLLEQKQRAKQLLREDDKGNTSPVETHYVEMHGIIRSDSELSK